MVCQLVFSRKDDTTMKQLMNKLMLSCKAATELVEKKQAVGLTAFEGMRLRLHLSMCTACHSYEKQSRSINRMMEQLFTSDKNENIKLSDDRKKKILDQLNRADKN